MAAITAALIKQVREDTGAGMMDVKKALTEAEGDVARAKEIIRAKGIQAAGKREGRKAQEGTIASKVIESAEGQTGYAVELNSETDFVAKTPKFVEFADTVLGYAVAADANNADELLAVPLFPCLVAPCCVRQIYASPIYKHRSAMDLPTKAAWPVRRYVVFRCRGFSPCLYTRERVLKSLESPLPLFTYRIAYFSQKNNRQDIRIPTFGFILIYKLFLFVLYVLTNRLLV